MNHVQMINGTPVRVCNIFCIGRNYTAHIKELGNQAEEEPVVFLKPSSSLSFEDRAIVLPSWSKAIHYEAELVLLIGKGGKNMDPSSALSHVAGYGVGLDLTARDRQTQAKAAGLPWTVCKGFDQAACVSRFLPAADLLNPEGCQFTLHINGAMRQHGQVKHMLFNLQTIMSYLSTMFTLSAGDLIFTGTPEGVGQLMPNDHLTLQLDDVLKAEFVVGETA
jgi:2-keto-4-pentenoate hydratase/2-oxohepta-3-ene-1,7-dioic acid hydratase in catechol pathway